MLGCAAALVLLRACACLYALRMCACVCVAWLGTAAGEVWVGGVCSLEVVWRLGAATRARACLQHSAADSSGSSSSSQVCSRVAACAQGRVCWFAWFLRSTAGWADVHGSVADRAWLYHLSCLLALLVAGVMCVRCAVSAACAHARCPQLALSKRMFTNRTTTCCVWLSTLLLLCVFRPRWLVR